MIGCGRARGSGNRWDGVKRHKRKPFTPRWLRCSTVLSPVCAMSLQCVLFNGTWAPPPEARVRLCMWVCVCVCAHIFLPCQGFARLRDFKTGSCHYASALCWPPRGHSFPLWVLLWMLQCHVKMCYLDVHRILMRNFHRGPKPAEKKANKCTYSFFFFLNTETWENSQQCCLRF